MEWLWCDDTKKNVWMKEKFTRMILEISLSLIVKKRELLNFVTLKLTCTQNLLCKWIQLELKADELMCDGNDG
jgi:hypothetical protein